MKNFSAVHIIFIVRLFHSWVKMKSTNRPAPNVWVVIAQLVEHCSVDAEAIESNSTEVLKFFWVNLQLLELKLPLV